ncbi:type VI secretion system-associated protein TagF [Novosphingobium terrae]|uniref:type VI secretion system-associated protein TagF n=1 Tax=Novosphingobium terrae TaxID=2726189 RepID=UPI00197FA2D1|nr:type VI secretion system-associated protein TagF [Novosphingobium terrae]
MAVVALLFGKLPSHGDFVARGLPAAERAALDGWLSGEVDAARRMFAAAFDDLYDRAPPWRFARAEGPVGAAGVLAPSIDLAGRRFPLYLALAGVAAEALVAAAHWCEDMLHHAFVESWHADRLVEETARFAGGSLTAGWTGARWWSDGGEGFAPGVVEGLRPPRLLSMMLQPQEDA